MQTPNDACCNVHSHEVKIRPALSGVVLSCARAATLIFLRLGAKVPGHFNMTPEHARLTCPQVGDEDLSVTDTYLRTTLLGNPALRFFARLWPPVLSCCSKCILSTPYCATVAQLQLLLDLRSSRHAGRQIDPAALPAKGSCQYRISNACRHCHGDRLRPAAAPTLYTDVTLYLREISRTFVMHDVRCTPGFIGDYPCGALWDGDPPGGHGLTYHDFIHVYLFNRCV